MNINNQKGFANILVIIGVVMLVGVAGYFTFVKKSVLVEPPQADNSQNTQTTTSSPFNNTGSQNLPPTQPPAISHSSLPTPCVDQPEAKAVITSLSSYSGPVGTKLEIRGCNFSGFEGGFSVWMENSKGIKGIIRAELPNEDIGSGSNSKLLRITIPDLACQKDISSSGLQCDTLLTLVPGKYKMYSMSFGRKSNEAEFTVLLNRNEKEMSEVRSKFSLFFPTERVIIKYVVDGFIPSSYYFKNISDPEIKKTIEQKNKELIAVEAARIQADYPEIRFIYVYSGMPYFAALIDEKGYESLLKDGRIETIHLDGTGSIQ